MSGYRDHLIALRAELAGIGLNGFLLATGDEHITEYPAAYAKRLAWLTGFKGSTGSAAVLMDRAALFVDGRYIGRGAPPGRRRLLSDRTCATNQSGRAGWPSMAVTVTGSAMTRACIPAPSQTRSCRRSPHRASGWFRSHRTRSTGYGTSNRTVRSRRYSSNRSKRPGRVRTTNVARSLTF